MRVAADVVKEKLTVSGLDSPITLIDRDCECKR
jgi:hypothetical protein